MLDLKVVFGDNFEAQAEYLIGKAQNEIIEGDGLGSPWHELVINSTILGPISALLWWADITPDGSEEKAGQSQWTNALQIFSKDMNWGDRFVGSFSRGVTFADEYSVARGQDGEYYTYVGSDPFPKVVSAGINPSGDLDFEIIEWLSHNSNSGRNDVGAHDDIYIRTVTSAQAIAEDAKIGTRYKLSDYQEAGYDVVDASDTGGFYVEGLLSGRKLRLVQRGDIYAEYFGIEYDSSYQDDKFLAMLAYLESTNANGYFSGRINLNTNISLELYPNLQLYGVGKESELYWPDLETGVGLATGGVQHTGLTLEKFKISAPPSSGLQVTKFAELYQGCRIADIIIRGGNIGCEITDSWVSTFDNVYVRDGGTYGVIIRSANSSEQVNAINIRGVYSQGYQHNWYFDGITGGGRAIYIATGSSERSRKTSVIIDGFGSVTFGPGFYFEANYTDAVGASGEVLDKTKPVNVLVTRTGAGVFDGRVAFDKCYIAVRNDFNTPTEVVSTYISPLITGTPTYYVSDIQTEHVCNTTSYVDFDLYNDSDTASVTQLNGPTNSANRYRGRVGIAESIKIDLDVQTGFTSTWENIHNTIIDGRDAYLKLECTTAGTTTSALNIVVEDTSDSSVIGSMTIPAGSYTVGQVLKFRVPRLFNGFRRLEVNSPATGDNVRFTAFLCRVKKGDGGSNFTNGNAYFADF
ncbi:hypothetical protein [Pseudoalteromonas phage PH357]|nr:hypothetical protein [Pseudoalteromonas phage PH357]